MQTRDEVMLGAAACLAAESPHGFVRPLFDDTLVSMNQLLTFTLALFTVVAASAAPKTLAVCTEASPDGFDYSIFHANSTADASSEALYNRLVEFEPGTTQLIPALAERWDASPDARVFTFSLRRGVKFHTTPWFTPSRDFNADDVIYSITRQLNPKHPWFNEARQGWYYASAMQFPSLIKSVTKLDPYTVRIELNRPEAPFLADMAMGFMSMLSAEYAEKLQKAGAMREMSSKPVGTGPFVFRSYVKDANVRYEANPSYFRGRVKLDKLIFSIAPDTSVRLQRMKAGECELMLYPSPQSWPEIQANPKLKLVTGSPLTTTFIALNVEHKPLDNKLVRQALNYAIDRRALLKALHGDSAELAANPYPQSQWGWDASASPYPLDLAKARALLAQAGLAKGFSIKLWARAGAGGSNPNPKLTAELLQADWAKIGVKVEIVTLEWGELLHRQAAGEHDTAVLAWASDNGDPDNFLTPTLACAAVAGGGNASRWCNPAFDKLIDAARQSADQPRREQLYRQAQALFREEAPWVPLLHPLMGVVTSPRVSGYKISPFTLNNYANVDLAP